MLNTHTKTPLRTGFLRSLIRWLVIGMVLFWALALAAPCGRPLDRPADDRSAHAAPLAGLDSPHAVPRTLQIHSAQPNLGRSPARCNRRRGRAFLPAPWILIMHEIQIAAEDDLEGDRTRGASTITQQLVKPILRNAQGLSSARAQRSHWYRWLNSSSASGAFWRYTST